MSVNHLITLVGTLCPAEKKAVTSSLQLRKGDKDLYLKYFKIISKKQQCDVKYLQKKLNISANNLSVLKTRLTDAILEVLIHYNSKNSSIKELRNTINEIEILVDKQLYQLAYKKCESTIKKGELSGNAFITAELQQLKIQTGLYAKKLGIKQFESASKELNEAINDLADNTNAQLGRISLNFDLSLSKQINEGNLSRWMYNYRRQKAKKNWIFAFNFLSNISVYHHLKKEDQERLDVVTDYITSFGDNQELKLKYATQYICCLNTALIVGQSCSNHQIVEMCLRELNLPEIPKTTIKLSSTIIFVQLTLASYYIERNNREEAQGEIELIARQTEKIQSNLDPKTEIMIRFLTAKAQFETKDLKGALSSLNKIIREKWANEFLQNPSSINHVSYEAFLGFRVLILCVLKDTEVDYFIRSYQLKLEKIAPLNSLQKLFISFCSHFNSYGKRNNIEHVILSQYKAEDFKNLKDYPLMLFYNLISKEKIKIA